MGYIRKKKGEAGIANQYISRTQAIRKLQISLNDFNRLCIYKGIYPRVPNKRKKAQHGDQTLKTLYLKSDIRFIMHESNIWKFRDEKVRRRKMKQYEAKKEKEKFAYLRNHEPEIKLDQIILERYPKFEKALLDLDDALTSCFLNAALFSSQKATSEIIALCRKLTVEFMAYVIEAKALRKAFITFKGYYYRANIHGIDITWVSPHPFPVDVPKGIDMLTMKHSLDLHTSLLTFVNFKLFQSLNLYYPLRFIGKVEGKRPSHLKPEKRLDYFASLNTPLKAIGKKAEAEKEEEFDADLLKGVGLDLTEIQRKQVLIAAQKKLFNGCKFFLGRETNRESLILVIRSAGGEVSWDSTLGIGATYNEDDPNITHQIVDRPAFEKKSLRRYYLQPQWVYDSFNFSVLLPVQDYFIGADLPPHLSPFEETYDAKYTPPDMVKILKYQRKIYFKEEVEEFDENTLVPRPIIEESEESEEEERRVPKKYKHKSRSAQRKKMILQKLPIDESDSENVNTNNNTKSGIIDTKKDKTPAKKDVNSEAEEPDLTKMKVARGRFAKKNIKEEKMAIEKNQKLMTQKLIHKRDRRVYHALLRNEKKEEKKRLDLQNKRKLFDLAVKKQKKLVTKL